MTDGFGGSDHQSFYAKKIPVLFAFTGIHGDYHRPSDDSDRINYSGMARIADYLELIALDIVRRPERTAYVKVNDGHSHAARRRPRASRGRPMASLGIMPDYAHEAKDGLSLSGVREGGPAAQAGLKEGDLIIKLGDRSISTIYDYMESMEQAQARRKGRGGGQARRQGSQAAGHARQPSPRVNRSRSAQRPLPSARDFAPMTVSDLRSVVRLSLAGLLALEPRHRRGDGCEPLWPRAWSSPRTGRSTSGIACNPSSRAGRSRQSRVGQRTDQLEWLIVDPGDDVARLLDAADPPDMLLGGRHRYVRATVAAKIG